MYCSSTARHHFKHIRLPKGPFRANGHSNVYRIGWGDGNYVEDYVVTAVMKRKKIHLYREKNVHFEKTKSQFNLSPFVLVNFVYDKT